MSEFLAEARILVRPDTSRFRTDLEAQLKSVLARPVKIPVIPVVGPGFAAAAAGTTAFTVAQESAAAATAVTADALASATTIQRQYAGAVDLSVVSTNALVVAQEKEVVAATAASAAQSRATANATKGIVAQLAALFGLRAGTLAASSAFIGGTVAVLAFAKAVQSAASLETELNVFRVTAGATADEMERVSTAAKQLGRDITLPGVTAGNAATAMTELAKAGLSVQDSLDGARGTLQLATAAQIDVKDATELVAGALNAFGLAGTDAVKVADLLAGAAKESQGEITDMSTALGQAAAVSKLFGVSIEDTVTLLTQLAQAGISGGRAGTSLRVAFLRLVNPPADAARALKNLNVQLRDVQGNLRPEIFTDITEALKGYTRGQRQATLATIFGSDATRTAAIIGLRGAEAFEKTRIAISESGIASETAAARTQGLAGDFANLQNQMETLGTEIGQAVSGPLSGLVTSFAEIAGGAVDAIDAFKDLRKEVAKKFDFNVPGTNETGGSLGDKIVKNLFLTSPAFIKLTKETLDNTILGVINHARDTVAREKRIAQLGQKGGVFGVGDLIDPNLQAIVKSGTFGVGGFLKGAAKPPAGFNVEQIQNIILGFDAKQVRDKIAKDNAQLVADLQAEQDFLIGQLQRQFVKNRPALQRAIEQALLGTVNEIERVQDAAKQKAEQLRRERESNFLAAQSVAREGQQNVIAAAGLTTTAADDAAAQKRLRDIVLAQIAAVKAQITDQKTRAAALVALNAVLIGVNGALKSIADTQKAAAEERRQAQRDLQDEILNTRLSAADLTEDTADNKRILNLQIKALEDDIKRQQRIAKLAAANSKVQIDALIKVQKDQQRINAIKAQIKGLQGQGGFSLQDLFNEAVNQFRTFGSNIGGRTAILSSQDARASLGQAAANDLRGRVEVQQLSEAERQTALLAQINEKLSGPGLTPGQARNVVSAAGNAGGWRAAQEAANFAYGNP